MCERGALGARRVTGRGGVSALQPRPNALLELLAEGLPRSQAPGHKGGDCVLLGSERAGPGQTAIPALGELRQEDCREFEASLGHGETPVSKKIHLPAKEKKSVNPAFVFKSAFVFIGLCLFASTSGFAKYVKRLSAFLAPSDTNQP